MAAVHRHNALLKASIISATNAHRLGANEAPPAIISIFTGSQLATILEFLEKSSKEQLANLSTKEAISVGVAQIPEILIDNTDRNRTSPFAFTGNRFEFRAVGSSANCASAMIALNAAVADQLNSFRRSIDERTEAGESLEDAIIAEVRKLIIESKTYTSTETAIPTNGRPKPPVAASTARHQPRACSTPISASRQRKCLPVPAYSHESNSKPATK